MKFKLVENFSGQTDLKWEIIKTSIDKNIVPLKDEEKNDCRYGSIHHINSNHKQPKNNLMLIPHSMHSSLTRAIEKAVSNSMGGNSEAISVKTTLDLVRSRIDDFVAIRCPHGVLIVWKYYVMREGKFLPDVSRVDIHDAIQTIETGYDFTTDQISIDDYMKNKEV